MTPRKRRMKQAAFYWSPAVNDGFGGRSFGSAQARNVRWEDRAELFRSAEGRELTSSAVVYVDQDVQVGGYIVRNPNNDPLPPGSGTLDLFSSLGAREIRQLGESPSLRQTDKLIKAWL